MFNNEWMNEWLKAIVCLWKLEFCCISSELGWGASEINDPKGGNMTLLNIPDLDVANDGDAEKHLTTVQTNKPKRNEKISLWAGDYFKIMDMEKIQMNLNFFFLIPDPSTYM